MNFSWIFGNVQSNEIPDIFPVPILPQAFVEIDMLNIYTKILTDVADRTDGLTEDDQKYLWDNCLAGETSDGLITRIARAMYCKGELFLVLNKTAKVLREATQQEIIQIKADYAKEAESSVGVYISFKKYCKTDILKIYSLLEFGTVGSMYKSSKVSMSIQLKIDQLRASVASIDSSIAITQAKTMVKALKDGRDILLDAKDSIETAQPDTTAAEKSMNLYNQKRSFYLGLPASYVTGELNSGLGDTGQADSKAVERGLKPYFNSIFKPVCQALFEHENLTFKSEDIDGLEVALETLKTFEITDSQFLSDENKLKIVNKRFGLPPDTLGGPKPPVIDPNVTSKPTDDPNKPGAPVVVPPKV